MCRWPSYDVTGKFVRQLVDGVQAAGPQAATWDGTAANGDGVASGVYFYRLRVGDVTDVRRMVLLK